MVIAMMAVSQQSWTNIHFWGMDANPYNGRLCETPACPKHTSIEVLANYSSLSSASPIKISATELRGIRIDQLLGVWTFSMCLKDWLKLVGIIVNLRKNTHKSLELAILSKLTYETSFRA